MLKRFFPIVALPFAVALVLGGCQPKPSDKVLARVGHVNITERDLKERLADIPEYYRPQYTTPEGRIELLEKMIQEEVLYQAAQDAGYDRNPEVVETVERVRRRTMVQKYFQNEIEAAVEVPEDDIRAYYDEHDEMFQRRGRVKFRHIMTKTRRAAEKARERALAGEDFARLARELSVDQATREAGGLTASIPIGQGLPSAGMGAEFIKGLLKWNVGEVTDVLRSDKGWHVIRIEEKVEPGKRPLEEVRDEIVRTLKPAAVKEHFDETYAQLKKRYNATLNERAVRPKPRTEEELFTLAQETEDPLERLNYYKELVFNYPDGEHAAEAQFMIGFIYAEELKSYESARIEFEKMLDKYPDSELVDSARWMLENMGKESPPFEDEGGAASQ